MDHHQLRRYVIIFAIPQMLSFVCLEFDIVKPVRLIAPKPPKPPSFAPFLPLLSPKAPPVTSDRLSFGRMDHVSLPPMIHKNSYILLYPNSRRKSEGS